MCGSSSENMKKVVKDVTDEGDSAKNCMIFGVQEIADENLHDQLSGIMEEHIGVKPRVVDSVRVGKVNPKSARPIKVTVTSQATALEMLRNSNKLTSMSEYKYVHIQPDRNLQERIVHKTLVN